MAKTAMTELIEWMKIIDGTSTFSIICKATELLAKEKQQLIDAYESGRHNFFHHKSYMPEIRAEEYFTQTYSHSPLNNG